MKLRQRDLALSRSRACEVLGSSLDAWIRHYSLESHTTVPKANTCASHLVDLLRLNWHKTCWSLVDGNPHSRCPLCVARHAREPGIHHSGAAFTGAGHRSKPEHLQVDRQIPAAAAAGTASRATDHAVPRESGRNRRELHLSAIRAVSRSQSFRGGAVRLCLPADWREYRRAHGTGAGAACFARVFLDAGYPRDFRASFHGEQ